MGDINMSLKIDSIKQTVFFVKRENKLFQKIDISIQNFSKRTKLNLKVKFPTNLFDFDLGWMGKGEKIFSIYLPAVFKNIKVEFLLFSNHKIEDRKFFDWKIVKRWTVYLIHLSHHDLGYTDLPSNVLKEYNKFYDEILKFCKKTDNFPNPSKFRYTVEQFWSISNFIKNAPLRKIRELIKYIRKGRIEITGLFSNQITELCSHEELVRLIYPSFNLKKKYNFPICTAYQNDITGLSWGLVSVLANSGIKYLSSFLPSWYYGSGEKRVHPYWDEDKVLPLEIPGIFIWEGPDKSKIFFYLEPDGPLYFWNYKKAILEIEKRLNLLEEKNYPFEIVKYSVIGGIRDNSPPLLSLSYIVKEWNRKWAYPKLILGTNFLFFKDLDRKYKKILDNLPVFRGELPNTDYVIGSLSTPKETGINRISHEQISTAEKFATISSILTDYPYPKEIIDKAYENIILYDEHTWGMDSPLGPAQDAHLIEKKNFAYRGNAFSHNIISKSVNKIVDEIKMDREGEYIVVFNPLSWKRDGIVRVPFKEIKPHERPMFKQKNGPMVSHTAIGRNIFDLTHDIIKGNFSLIDLETEEEIPYQIDKIEYHYPLPYSSSRYGLSPVNDGYIFELIFFAKGVPPLGYKTYLFVPEKGKSNYKGSVLLKGNVIENQFYRISFDDKGKIKSIYDKELGKEIVDKDAPHSLNQIILRWAKDHREEYPENVKFYRGRNGEICKSILIFSKLKGIPEIIQEILLYDNIKRIDFNNRILKDSTPLQEVYISFPFLIENPEFKFEASNSIVEPLKDQFPGSNSDYYTIQHWTKIFNEEIEIVFSSIEAPVVEFSKLWEGYVSYAHHSITPPGFGHRFRKYGEFKKGWIYSYIFNNNFRTNFSPVETFESLFRYSITSFRNNNCDLKARNFGWEFLNPLIPVCIKGKKEGKLPLYFSFCEISEPNVVLLTFKKAEDNNGYIIRLIETEGKNTDVSINFPFFKIKKVYKTNLIEENIDLIPSSSHKFSISIKPFAISTFRIIGSSQ